MKAFRKLGIATIVAVALSGAAWAHPGNGNGGGNGNGNSNGNGNGGRGNDALHGVINVPQITMPLIHRSGSQQLAPVATHKLPSNSITDNHGNRGIGLRDDDFRKDHGRDMGRRFDNLDRKQVTTKVDEKSEKAERVEKAEKEIETRLAANTADDASGARKTEGYRPEPSCR